jgi:hypothetical protein
MELAMRRISSGELHALKVAELSLDPDALDLTTVEALAGALRRAASFLCPCTAPSLIRAVVQPLRGLVDDLEATEALVDDILDAAVAHGDILEQRDVGENPTAAGTALLYAAPPSFLIRKSGTAILLGIASDQLSALPEDLESRIQYVHHVRLLRPVDGEDLRNELRQLGLIELSYERWLNAPPMETAERHLERLNAALDATQPSRDIPGLSLIDPERPVRYYRGRWVDPKSQSGRFVARRAQAYGAHLWCYVQTKAGNPERMVDFPVANSSRWRGCDEAWRLQMALDARRGQPQQFRVRASQGRTSVIEFFSPVPMWARRRWDAVGEPVSSSGCLFAYRIADAEMEEELHFIRTALWLGELADGTNRS